MTNKQTTERFASWRTIPLVVVAGLIAPSLLMATEPVNLHSGRITGEVLDQSIGLQAFRGIPFAAPPVGKLRWQPPQDVAHWNSVRKCVEFGSALLDQIFALKYRSERTPERGAFHSAEMNYVFNTLHPAEEKCEDPELAKAMIRYWVHFAKTGDPNVDGLPEWPRYGDNAAYIELGDEIKANSAFRVQEFELLSEL